QAEDGIRDPLVTGVQTCALPISKPIWKRVLSFFGPAYLVSVGYMDPGNWATDLAGGSKFGYSLLWVLLMSNLMAILLQSLSARRSEERRVGKECRSWWGAGV